MEFLLQEASNFLQSRNIHGRVLFAMYGGSRAYNLAKPTSDMDLFAVYSASPTSFWGLRMPPENLTGKIIVNNTPCDVNMLEVGKFCSLLISGNPTIIEALYASNNISKSLDTWENLKQHRKRFLSNDLIKQYISFSVGQVAQIKSKPENNKKKIYNAIRLLMEARRLIEGKEPRVWLDGTDHQYLMDIRNEKYDLQELLQQAQATIDELQAKKPWNLLSKVDEEWVNQWLINHREEESTN
eukprot:Phypoly_transcript_15748.p1 GENE.Phypoly_transcript_15748~~Phypoly_transcript_15748.p1  ORF type:complete len:241 (+),score=41.60 Phypoly_transcript_15748:145-867(+)